MQKFNKNKTNPISILCRAIFRVTFNKAAKAVPEGGLTHWGGGARKMN